MDEGPIDEALLDRNRDEFSRTYEGMSVADLVEAARDAESQMAETRELWVGKECAWYGDLLQRVPGARVLEVGAGAGQTSMYLLALGVGHLTSVELADGAKDLIEGAATELGRRDAIDVRIGDFLDMDLEPHSYDLVICEAVLHHIPPEGEDAFAARTAELVTADGMTRLSDPAVNSRVLDEIRWAIPTRSRPSRLQRRKFDEWQANDVHPVRDNSTDHVVELFSRYYERVESMTHGVTARLVRYIEPGPFQKQLVRFDARLPESIRRPLAAYHGVTAWGPKV